MTIRRRRSEEDVWHRELDRHPIVARPSSPNLVVRGGVDQHESVDDVRYEVSGRQEQCDDP
ncbi:hypothetical protein Tdes44962_MAKER09473 [Teratosphaeria destructans]|uniref:Uncharacterized protein n=1 Tax=Teratosphaeria destructans TaxID=418781 RepID=A0A9W7SST2_9PEZI|nr:hypothetical protein Tdes44962_MAKER09473 [Teratosphaeria destructans]